MPRSQKISEKQLRNVLAEINRRTVSLDAILIWKKNGLLSVECKMKFRERVRAAEVSWIWKFTFLTYEETFIVYSAPKRDSIHAKQLEETTGKIR